MLRILKEFYSNNVKGVQYLMHKASEKSTWPSGLLTSCRTSGRISGLTSGRTSGRTSSAWISLAGGLPLAPLVRGADTNGGGGSGGPCCWSKSIPKRSPPSGERSLSPNSDIPLENSSMPVCRSVRTVKSTSASRLEVELTVMLEHLRSMPRWVSFR